MASHKVSASENDKSYFISETYFALLENPKCKSLCIKLLRKKIKLLNFRSWTFTWNLFNSHYKQEMQWIPYCFPSCTLWNLRPSLIGPALMSRCKIGCMWKKWIMINSIKFKIKKRSYINKVRYKVIFKISKLL